MLCILERSKKFADADEGMLKCTLGVAKFRGIFCQSIVGVKL